MFKDTDFPPVALLVPALKENNLSAPELINFIQHPYFPKKEKTPKDGINTHPLLLDSYIQYIENEHNIQALITEPDTTDYNPTEMESIPLEVFIHLKRFGLNIQEILQWSSALLRVKTDKELNIEDGYYITAIRDYINPASYTSFARNPNSIHMPTGRINYDNIISFVKLRNDLRNIGETFDGFQVFCLAENHKTEEIIELLKNGYDLPEIIMYGRLGYRTVEEIETHGKLVPEEWLDLVKDIK